MVRIVDDAIEGEIEIASTPEEVFRALTDPEQLASWWGSDELYRTFNWQLDVRPGGKWSCDARSAKGQMSVHGVYQEVDPPRVLAYTWNPSWEPALPSTTIRYVLEPSPNGTLLRISHTGFASHQESARGHQQGWERVLAWLQDFSRSLAYIST